jgi:hypothetical protein
MSYPGTFEIPHTIFYYMASTCDSLGTSFELRHLSSESMAQS